MLNKKVVLFFSASTLYGTNATSVLEFLRMNKCFCVENSFGLLHSIAKSSYLRTTSMSLAASTKEGERLHLS